MKLQLQSEARRLRKKGYSMRTIQQMLSVSRSSVSHWVREIELSSDQIRQLQTNPYKAIAVEKRRSARLLKENARRESLMIEAAGQVKKVNKENLFFLGVALYWGEGTKSKRGVVEFTNSDPDTIQTMMAFFKVVCKVPPTKFRGHVYLHEHLSVKGAEKYWSDISGIPTSQFHKTSVQQNRKRLHKDTLQHGTFAIVICDTALKLNILGWIRGVINSVPTSSD